MKALLNKIQIDLQNIDKAINKPEISAEEIFVIKESVKTAIAATDELLIANGKKKGSSNKVQYQLTKEPEQLVFYVDKVKRGFMSASVCWTLPLTNKNGDVTELMFNLRGLDFTTTEDAKRIWDRLRKMNFLTCHRTESVPDWTTFVRVSFHTRMGKPRFNNQFCHVSPVDIGKYDPKIMDMAMAKLVSKLPTMIFKHHQDMPMNPYQEMFDRLKASDGLTSAS